MTWVTWILRLHPWMKSKLLKIWRNLYEQTYQHSRTPQRPHPPAAPPRPPCPLSLHRRRPGPVPLRRADRPSLRRRGSDPLAIVNNLSEFIFSIIKALGIIILGWGIVQVGMSFQSHDASQRTQGFLCLFGGLMIAFAKEILGTIGVV